MSRSNRSRRNGVCPVRAEKTLATLHALGYVEPGTKADGTPTYILTPLGEALLGLGQADSTPRAAIDTGHPDGWAGPATPLRLARGQQFMADAAPAPLLPLDLQFQTELIAHAEPTAEPTPR